MLKSKPEEGLHTLREKLAAQSRELAELRSEVTMLRDALYGEPRDGIPWAIMKVHRQRKALDILHSKVVRQRFQLRVLNELGRGLTRDEFLAAKAQVRADNEDVGERIGPWED